MSTLPRTQFSPVEPGMLSLVLGTVALLLFFLPILGIPISAIGLLFGIVGIIVGILTVNGSLRWSLMGSAASLLALAINLAIAYAPAGHSPSPGIVPSWQPVPDRPYVAPPA
jgi:hypothetical protein